MIRLTLALTMVVALLAGNGWAQDHHPEDDWAAWNAERTARAEREARLDELMGRMTGDMAAIRDAKSTKERQALMATHKEHMREAMGLMRSMGGKHLREVMADHLQAGAQSAAESRAPMWPRADMSDAQRLTDLENRMDMMQVMVESLMDNSGGK